MFKKQKKSTPKNLTTNTKNGAAITVTYITESTTITANMTCKDDVRIAGTLEGELESKKKVIITESGKVKGKITSPSADISGKVDGDIHAEKTLILRASAVVEGEINTGKVKIEQGAEIKGSFQVGNSTSSGAKNSS